MQKKQQQQNRMKKRIYMNCGKENKLKSNIDILELPGEERQKEIEEIFEVLMAKTFKNTVSQQTTDPGNSENTNQYQ